MEGVLQSLGSRLPVRVVGRRHRGKNGGETASHGRRVVTPCGAAPPDTELPFELGLELLEKTAAIETPLDRRDVEILRVADEAVELGEEDFADGLGPTVGLAALDLEEDSASLGVQLELSEAQPDVRRPRGVSERCLANVSMQRSVPWSSSWVFWKR